MNSEIRKLLESVQAGKTSVDDAMLELKKAPFEDIGYAKVDLHRKVRQGAAEVIYGAGKTPEQIGGIIDAMRANGQRRVLITRMSPEAAAYVGSTRELDYHKDARVGIVGGLPQPDGIGKVVIATGGTSDIPVAEEAALTLSDDVLASAYNGAVTVLKSEIQDEYDQMLSQYVAYYAQYGYSVDEYDTELQASVAQETVQTKLSTSIVRHYAAQNGYELTEEKKTELAAQVKTALDNTREYLESYLSASGFTGDELNAAVEEQMAQAGYTEETLMDSAELNDVLNFLYERATADVTVTEDEVKAAFDEKVAKQKESYASVDAFVNDYVNESEILYTPENVRLMECIFVASVEGEATEDEATADEATADEATVSEATAGEAADIASLTGYAKAKAIAAAIAGGADFEETMKAYNEDSSTEEQMLRGYPVAENSTTYGEAFMAGAMALEHVGDVSDVIVTDYGYFILRYAKDLESGEADFEARKETETEETLTNKKNDAYSAFIDTILDEADIQVGDLSQMYHVYVGEAVEATVAYASVNADTKLLDMPGGDAVADMKAGASVDILGSIDADGKTYSFVAVPGTEIKGYVGADMLDEMAEDAALAVDNAALVSRVEQIDKNPTFTIAMNDGSLIYGELYPEKAPESVGNFVSLANGSFYDEIGRAHV